MLSALVILSPLLLIADSRTISTIVRSSHTCPAIEEEPWSYTGDSNGPSAWGKSFPNCYGHHQSPVDLDRRGATTNSSLQALQLSGYDKLVTKADIVNNGHTVMMTPKDGITRTLTIEGVTYSLSQVHFHWGSKYYEGTEHTFDENAYALECHFVHKSEENKLAVIGVLYQSSQGDPNYALSPIVKELEKVSYKNALVEMRSSLNLRELLPPSLASYFRYSGSLTTPPCDEGVIWTVMKSLQKVGNNQMKKFRILHAVEEDEEKEEENCHLSKNFRPIQPLNDRTIFISK